MALNLESSMLLLLVLMSTAVCLTKAGIRVRTGRRPLMIDLKVLT